MVRTAAYHSCVPTRVLYVMGTSGGSGRYRCHHRVEQLAAAGMAATVVPFGECDLDRAVREHDAFVLHRVKHSPRVARFLVAARWRRKPVVYDTDDLVFEPDLVELLQLPDGMTFDRRREKLARQRETMRLCDAVTVSTAPLAEHARSASRTVHVVPNVVTREQVELGLAARRAAAGDGVTLGYFSGSATHDRDFASIAEPLLRVLERRPHARLLVAGPLSLDGRFEALGERLERAPLRPWQELPSLLATVDVNLAPLEPENAFTAGKSCVKYLEAALVDVATVASGFPDFARVIADGENGFLVDGAPEWEQVLERLVADAELRRRVGAAAGAQVREHETTDARALELGSVLSGIFESSRPGVARAAGALLGHAVRRVR
jgi:glycosyltransferase involved in cell wall biosynthesis